MLSGEGGLEPSSLAADVLAGGGGAPPPDSVVVVVTCGRGWEWTGAVVDAVGGCALVAALVVVVLPTVDHQSMHSMWYSILPDLIHVMLSKVWLA